MSEEQKLIGIIDEPIKPHLKSDSNDQSDRLGVDDYANALGEFIKKTNTPMTIGIQGEWGSGKTSLLNNLMNLLDGVKQNTTYECIWVNTWEHSLLKNPEEALISIVTDISQQVTLLNKDNKMAGQITTTGKKLLSGAVRVAAGMTMGLAGQEVARELLDTKVDNSIKKLREDLESFIDKIINDDQTQEIKNIKKIVFFIDDLDRIEPKDAVKVLELLKNIFSIKHCVFVLAIDYQVIIKGLKDKFGEKTDENEREFRSFFDKIIQLPFTMPTSQYSVAQYVEGLLRDIGFVEKNEKFDLEVISEILENTIGSNPRSIKRLINNLSLLNILGNIKQKKNSTSKIKLEEKLLEFALVCCQVAFPKIYELITERPSISDWDDDFAFNVTQKKEEQDPMFKQLFINAAESEDFDDDWEKTVFKITYASFDLQRQATKISRFLSILVEQKIKHTEEDLIKILSNTSATVVTSNDSKNFKRPEKYAQVGSFEEFLKVCKSIASEKYDKRIVEYRAEFFEKIYEYIITSTKGNNNFLIKYFSRNLSFYGLSPKGVPTKRFALMYPLDYKKSKKGADKIFGICFLKDPARDFRLPKIDGMTSAHSKGFSRTAKFWSGSETYDIFFSKEAFEKNKDKIILLFERSREISENKEDTLNRGEFSNLTEDELLDLEKKSKPDYTYDV